MPKEVNKLYTAAFWKDAFERAVKTFVQVLATFFLANISLLDVAWGDAFGVSAAAAVLSVLTSLGSAPLGPDKGSPSLVDGE
jgi:hypothetical protein